MPPAATSTAGRKNRASLSAVRTTRARRLWASSIRLAIRATVVSLPVRSERMSSTPYSFRLPLHTASPTPS